MTHPPIKGGGHTPLVVEENSNSGYLVDGTAPFLLRQADGKEWAVCVILGDIPPEEIDPKATSDRLALCWNSHDDLVAALDALVNARALSGVREQVAGWNGEGKEDGPYQRHPNGLGATLPKTNCGRVYELDDAMQNARLILTKIRGDATTMPAEGGVG